MKTMIFLVALAMTSAAWGQAQKAPAEPSPIKEAAKQEAATQEAPKQKVSKPAAVARKSKRTQDARHCLQRSGNTEIIKCAEEFL